MIMYTPEMIFSNNIPLFDINFFNPLEDKYETKEIPKNISEIEEDSTSEGWKFIDEKEYSASTHIASAYWGPAAIDMWLNGFGYNEKNAKEIKPENEFINISGYSESEYTKVEEWKNEKDGKTYRLYEYYKSGSSSAGGTLIMTDYHQRVKVYEYIGKETEKEVIEDIDITETKVVTTYESTARILQPIVASWYSALRVLAIVAMLSILVYIGIRIVISSTARDKSKYKQMLMDWLVALCLIFMMHYIMSFIINVSNKLTEVMSDSSISNIAINIPPDTEIKTDATNNKWQLLTDFNDNQYADANQDKGIWVTNAVGAMRIYSELNNSGYEAFAYTIMYLVMVIYTCVFTFQYMRRVLYMAFLTMIAPLIAITYPIDRVNDGKAQGFSTWLREYIFNALIQPIHYIIYVITIGSVMELVDEHPVYAIVALGFMVPAEKFIRKAFGFEKAATVGAFGSAAGAAMLMTGLQRLRHSSKGKSKDDNSAKGEKDSIRKVKGTDYNPKSNIIKESPQAVKKKPQTPNIDNGEKKKGEGRKLNGVDNQDGQDPQRKGKPLTMTTSNSAIQDNGVNGDQNDIRYAKQQGEPENGVENPELGDDGQYYFPGWDTGNEGVDSGITENEGENPQIDDKGQIYFSDWDTGNEGVDSGITENEGEKQQIDDNGQIYFSDWDMGGEDQNPVKGNGNVNTSEPISPEAPVFIAKKEESGAISSTGSETKIEKGKQPQKQPQSRKAQMFKGIKNGAAAVNGHYARRIYNRGKKAKPIRALRRGITYGMGALTLGAIGLAAGIASGDPNKAAQYVMAGGAVGGALAKNLGDSAANAVDIDGAKESFKAAYYGEKYDEIERQKYKNDFKMNQSNYSQSMKRLGVDGTKELFKSGGVAEDAIDRGMNNIDDMINVQKAKQRYMDAYQRRNPKASKEDMQLAEREAQEAAFRGYELDRIFGNYDDDPKVKENFEKIIAEEDRPDRLAEMRVYQASKKSNDSKVSDEGDVTLTVPTTAGSVAQSGETEDGTHTLTDPTYIATPLAEDNDSEEFYQPRYYSHDVQDQDYGASGTTSTSSEGSSTSDTLNSEGENNGDESSQPYGIYYPPFTVDNNSGEDAYARARSAVAESEAAREETKRREKDLEMQEMLKNSKYKLKNEKAIKQVKKQQKRSRNSSSLSEQKKRRTRTTEKTTVVDTEGTTSSTDNEKNSTTRVRDGVNPTPGIRQDLKTGGGPTTPSETRSKSGTGRKYRLKTSGTPKNTDPISPGPIQDSYGGPIQPPTNKK